jgi:hypothetical protein
MGHPYQILKVTPSPAIVIHKELVSSIVQPINRYGIFNESYKYTQLCLPTLIKFVLQNGEIDKLRDADTASDELKPPVQGW